MLRKLHSSLGLIAALLLLVVALTGSVLSVYPTLQRAAARDDAGLDVATLAGRVVARLPGVESLVREASGVIIAYHRAGELQQISIIDPASGEAVEAFQPSTFQRWVKNLHRRLLLADAGRVAVGVAAACMAVLLVCGLLLLVRRMGGWRHLADAVRGTALQRWHSETSRAAVAGLLLSAATGMVLSLASFGWIPEGGDAAPPLDLAPSATSRLAIDRMPALQGIEASRLRQLKFAAPGDAGDVIELETVDGAGVVDPATGQWLAYAALDGWQRLNATVRMLHTGEGLWWLALLLGASALTVPVLVVTGFLLWRQRRLSLPRLVGTVAAREADTVLLVGSETNTTWGFAGSLQAALTRAGLRVHVAPMNELADGYRQARRLLVLTATYGDGEAPEGARQFLARLARLPASTRMGFAVLGFGDRQFPRFCGFAEEVGAALAAKGFEPLIAPGTVDRQSEPQFRRWCEGLGHVLGVALDIQHTPAPPRSSTLSLVSRTDYGADEQTRAAVLGFVPTAARSGWRAWFGGSGLAAWDTGDLLGVIPPDGSSPRYYSLASASSDGRVEICVRRQVGGACSTFLTGLQPGETIQAFVRPHESFRPAPGELPVILIGAGTGIGPLIGFIRHNPPQRAMYLYFGARNADDDFLYGTELQDLVGDRRLRALTTAFSRASAPFHVQDRLVGDASRLRDLIAEGAQVMVCGGRQMAEAVAAAWEGILAGTGLSVAQLRTQGRYVEDVY